MSCIKVFTRVLVGGGRWEGSGGWRPWWLEGLKKLVGERWTGDPGALGREAGGDSSSDCELSCSSSSSPSSEEEEQDEGTLLPGATFQYVDGTIAADPQERGIQVGVVGAVLGVFSHRQINLQALLPQSLEGEGLG